MEAILEVLSPGVDCRIVSSPQQGVRDLGVASGGAIDKWSAQKANILVANNKFDQCLEIPSGPVKLLNIKSCLVAIVGYGFQLKINGKKQLANYSFCLANGDAIEILNTKKSGTAYLAVCGGIRLTYKEKSMQNLGTNDHLVRNRKNASTSSIPCKGVRLETLTPVLRVLPGPEINILDKNIVNSFFNASWRIDRVRNRMGVRLSVTNPEVVNKTIPSLRSHAVVPGTIQINRADKCIALMADCQTTGGYPRIASIIEADLWKLAQLPVNAEVCFKLCSAKAANNELLKNTQAINRLSIASSRPRIPQQQ